MGWILQADRLSAPRTKKGWRTLYAPSSTSYYCPSRIEIVLERQREQIERLRRKLRAMK